VNDIADSLRTKSASTPARARWSLRRRLLVIAAVASIAAWLLGGTALYLALRDESNRLFDERLRQLAETVLAFADHELAETGTLDRRDPVHEEVAITMDSRYRFQIWASDGRLLLRSSSASASAPLAPLQTRGFFDASADGEALRVYTTHGRSGPTLIQVAESLSRRQTVVPTWGIHLITLFALSALALGVVSGALLRGALRALDESARQLATRGPTDLVPLESDNPPRELVPVLQSINALFARVETALSAERGFTELAAHELRTPLAAVRVQAQVARRSRSAQERDHVLIALEASVDRLSHLVDQLLALARINALQPAALERTSIDLPRLVDEVVADLMPMVAEKDVRLDLQLDARSLWGDPVGIAILLRNLLSNGIRHAPRGGQVRLESATDAVGVRLIVDDSGPGIAPHEQTRVLERFGGARKGVQTGGTGLGLSIVQSVARAHGASLTLGDAPLGGLRVELCFPLPPHAAADSSASTGASQKA